MKKGLSILLSLAIASLLVPRQAQTKEPIKIGVPMTLVGIAAQVGIDNRNGILLAAKHKKTIMGRPIKLIIEDEEGKPEIGIRKAEKLVYKDGVVALLGVAFSGVGLAIAGEADRLGVPFLTTNVMTPKFYGISKYVFRCGQLADDQVAVAHAMGILASPDLRKRTYYVLADDYAWGHSCSEAFIDLAQKKGIKIYNPKYDNAALNVVDWSPFVSKVAAAKVDGMYSCLRSPIIPRFVEQAHKFGLMKKIKVIAGGSPSEAALEAGGEAQIGIVTACAWSWDIDTPASKNLPMPIGRSSRLFPRLRGARPMWGQWSCLTPLKKPEVRILKKSSRPSKARHTMVPTAGSGSHPRTTA